MTLPRFRIKFEVNRIRKVHLPQSSEIENQVSASKEQRSTFFQSSKCQSKHCKQPKGTFALPFISSQARNGTGSTVMVTHHERTNSLSSSEMDLYIKGYHEYKEIWTPTMEQALKAVPEPKNVVDKYTVCVMFGG